MVDSVSSFILELSKLSVSSVIKVEGSLFIVLPISEKTSVFDIVWLVCAIDSVLCWIREESVLSIFSLK